MMKSALVLSSVLALATVAAAQMNPRGEAKATVAGKTVSVDYGRPSLKGRDMLGQAKVGQSWRMGADAATTLKTDADLAFGSAVVPKGSYVLTAKKVTEADWALVVSDNDRKVVAEVPLVSSKLPEAVETFTIGLRGGDKGGDIDMKWGTLSLKAPFTAK